MNAPEFAFVLEIRLQPLFDLPLHFVRVAAQFIGPVGCEGGDGGLGRIPVAGAVAVEVGGAVGEAAQGVAEVGDAFARHGAAELNAPFVQSLVGGGRCGRGAEKDGTGHAAAGVVAAEIGELSVQLYRPRAGAVDVALDDRRPVGGQIAGHLELHAAVVQGDAGRQDKRIAIARFPQRVDHCRHEAQHAACALEAGQRRPVRIEPLEHLGVDRVGFAHALFVVGFFRFGREFLCFGFVQIEVGAGHIVAGGVTGI